MPHLFRLGRRGWIVAVVLVGLVSSSCGGNSNEEEKLQQEASFCRLAQTSLPVSLASTYVLNQLAEVAPAELGSSMSVLLDLSQRLDELGADSAKALELEFEVRFSERYQTARRDVALYIADHCEKEVEETKTSPVESNENLDLQSD